MGAPLTHKNRFLKTEIHSMNRSKVKTLLKPLFLYSENKKTWNLSVCLYYTEVLFGAAGAWRLNKYTCDLLAPSSLPPLCCL